MLSCDVMPWSQWGDVDQISASQGWGSQGECCCHHSQCQNHQMARVAWFWSMDIPRDTEMNDWMTEYKVFSSAEAIQLTIYPKSTGYIGCMPKLQWIAGKRRRNYWWPSLNGLQISLITKLSNGSSYWCSVNRRETEDWDAMQLANKSYMPGFGTIAG